MFSFFKRVKKETERNKDDKKSKEPSKGESEEWQAVKAGEGPSKNTAKFESALEENIKTMPTHLSSSASAELRENCAVSEVAGPNNSETNDFPNASMNVKNNEQTKPLMSYAGALKIPEPRQNVKPCGHGTTAIAPRVPISGSKRENSSTPPASPKLEFKKFKERSNTTPELSRLSDIAEKPPDSPKNVTQITSSNYSPKISTKLHEDKEKNLINQEAKFQSELNDLTKQLAIRDAEASKLRFQMEELQRDVFAKSAGMDRLQSELQAANKESDMTKIRIRHLESDLVTFRENNVRLTETLETKSGEFIEAENRAQIKIEELQEVIRQLKTKINWLEQQIESLKQDKIAIEKQYEQLKVEKMEEEKKSKETLEQTIRQKTEIEAKWKGDFEKLRTINIMKEQDLLDDFEWKLREVQQNCKKRLEEKDKSMEERLLRAYKHAEQKMKEAEGVMEQLNYLKKYEVEVVKLRGQTEEQAQSLRDMTEKQEQMKAAEASLRNEAQRLRKMIDTEKENLQHMQRMHHQELVDKERKLQQTLDEKRMEIAIYWEDKLLHEIGRLKEELEQIYTEEQHGAIQRVRAEKEREFELHKKEWEKKMKECSSEIEFLKRSIDEKDTDFQEEVERRQTKTDQDILDLRRLMDKIDMTHHERFEKMVLEHERELENINRETEQRIREVEFGWQQQVTNLRKTLDMVKEQMEQESQQKISVLIEQHRSELDQQWENLIKQKQEAVVLVGNEYVSKYQALEENFLTQQKSHEQREIELLKTVDSLKNELDSKCATIEDLQNNVDTLEGGVQVLNQEIAQQSEDINKARQEADIKIRNLHDTISKLQQQQEEERTIFQQKLSSAQKQNQETIDHLQRRCSCLTKLFEEVRLRYERRESRQEDLNIMADLRQVIAEQEKDLACINEEKRYFQMRLMALEKSLEGNNSEEEIYQDADQDNGPVRLPDNISEPDMLTNSACALPPYPTMSSSINGLPFSIPPTIQECDDCDE